MEEAQSLDIGDQLMARRLELGYSLKDAAEYTRIRKVYLESLEANRFDDLPGEAYVTGFLKVYAGYLDLDSKPLLNELHALKEAPSLPARPVEATQKVPFSEGWGIFFVGLVAVLLFGVAVYFLSGLLPSDSATVTHSTLETVTKNSPIVDEEKLAAVQTTQLSEGQQSVAVQTNAPPPVEVKAEEPPQILPFVPQGGASLRMLALAESSLIMQLDGRKPRTYQLHPDLDLTWVVKQAVTLELEGPGVARFWLGKKELVFGDQLVFRLSQKP